MNRLSKLLFSAALTCSFAGCTAPLYAQSAPVCDVRAFGAKGDGATLDTVAVTNAIGACAKQGGGTVYFGPGHYVIGTVQLQSHIRLLLESGAVLVGSHQIADYLPSPPFGFARHYGVDITGEGAVLGMLIAKNADDVAIEGRGVIDGQSDNYMVVQTSHNPPDYDRNRVRNPDKFDQQMFVPAIGPIAPHDRPGTMIVFFHCTNVRVNGVTLHNAPNWTMHLQDVEGAEISGIQILNDQRVPNNDGIDCMQCKHVRISDCTIRAGDDDFAIVASENVNVSNCSLSSRSAAIRLESTQLSTFTGLTMDTNRGIAVFGDGYPGQPDRPTENVVFSDIAIRTRLIPGPWWGKAEPIYIAVQPCEPGAACAARVRNVTFNNINIDAENGSLLWGAEGTPVTGVSLNHVNIHMLAPDPAIAEGVGGNLDLRWTVTDPHEGIVKSDIPAIYAKKTAGLSLRDVHVDWAPSLPSYYTDAVRVEDFSDLTVDGFSGRQAAAAGGAALALAHGAGVAITNSRALPGTRSFVSLDRVEGRRVFVNYDLAGAAQAIEPAAMRFDVQLGPSGKK